MCSPLPRESDLRLRSAMAAGVLPPEQAIAQGRYQRRRGAASQTLHAGRPRFHHRLRVPRHPLLVRQQDASHWL